LSSQHSAFSTQPEEVISSPDREGMQGQTLRRAAANLVTENRGLHAELRQSSGVHYCPRADGLPLSLSRNAAERLTREDLGQLGSYVVVVARDSDVARDQMQLSAGFGWADCQLLFASCLDGHQRRHCRLWLGRGGYSRSQSDSDPNSKSEPECLHHIAQ